MKDNRFTKLLAAGVACAFALGIAFAQESSTTTTTTTGSTGTGTITTFSPEGNVMTVRTSTSTEPAMLYYTPQTVVVDPTGATVQISALRPDIPVSYTYTTEGGRMVITKVTLQKPISYYEKKETTTTTTTNP